MAFPDSINDQITDAVSQSLLTTVGTAQQVAAGTQQQAFVHALGLAMHNAAARQRSGQELADALVSAGLARAKATKGAENG